MAIDVHRIERSIALALCVGVALGTCARFLGRWHWAFELTTHFVVQATIGALVVAGLLFFRRHWRLASLTTSLALLNASEWVPFYWAHPPAGDPISQDSNASESLVVVSTNVLSRNHRSAGLDLWLADADLALISEVDPWWDRQLESWKGDWPYQIRQPRRDNFGVALLSRHPIVGTEPFELDGGIPAIQARIRTGKGEWTIVGLHPFPPAGRTYSTHRNLQLSSAANRIAGLARPRVVLGDLNSTSSSPMFRDFMDRTGLSDSRLGFGWQPTWPAGSFVLRIPIDHVLVDPDLVVVEHEVGPDIGSDHLPVRVRLERSIRVEPTQPPR